MAVPALVVFVLGICDASGVISIWVFCVMARVMVGLGFCWVVTFGCSFWFSGFVVFFWDIMST